MWDRGSYSTGNRGSGLSYTAKEKMGNLHPVESAAKMTQRLYHFNATNIYESKESTCHTCNSIEQLCYN